MPTCNTSIWCAVHQPYGIGAKVQDIFFDCSHSAVEVPGSKTLVEYIGPYSRVISINMCPSGGFIPVGLQKRSKKISSGAFISIMEFEDVIDSRKH